MPYGIYASHQYIPNHQVLCNGCLKGYYAIQFSYSSHIYDVFKLYSLPSLIFPKGGKDIFPSQLAICIFKSELLKVWWHHDCFVYHNGPKCLAHGKHLINNCIMKISHHSHNYHSCPHRLNLCRWLILCVNQPWSTDIPKCLCCLSSHMFLKLHSVQFSSVTQSCLTLCDTMDCSTASLSITNSQSLLKLMSIALVLPSNHLILCRPLLHPPSIFPSIRVFSNEVPLGKKKMTL